MASAAGDCLDFEVKLDLPWNCHHVLVAVAELAALPGAPSVDVAVDIDVRAMVFAACEVAYLLQEGLNAGRMTKDDGVQPGDAELAVAIISHGVKPLLVVHEDRVVRAAENLLDLDGQIKLRRHRIVLEVAVTELAVAALAPGVEFTIFSDTGGMLESASNLFNLELFFAIFDRDESFQRFALGIDRSVSAGDSAIVRLLRDTIRKAQFAFVAVAHHEQAAVGRDCRQVVLPAAHLLELESLDDVRRGPVVLKRITRVVEYRSVVSAAPDEQVSLCRDCGRLVAEGGKLRQWHIL